MTTTTQKWKALFLQRCPRCGEGRIYERGMKMNERCPVCNLHFERERGYFLGAMYVSYAMATAFLVVALVIGYNLFPDIDLGDGAVVLFGSFRSCIRASSGRA